MIMSTTTTTTQPNPLSTYNHHQYSSSAHHQFPHFSIDLNQDHHHHQQQQYLQQAAHFFSTNTTTEAASIVPSSTSSSSSSSPINNTSSLPYHIFIDDTVEDPDAAAVLPLSCRHLVPAAHYSSWGPPPTFLPQQQQQKANDIYGAVATEKMSGNDQMAAKWMQPPTATTKVRMVVKKNKKLTIKTNTTAAPISDHGRPNKYSSSAWDPQKMINNDDDTSPSTLQTTGHNNSPLSSPTVVLRVCADCNTTKTPLWRSGPRGPKSLCNACGIRQRKARRAMAAAAAAAAAEGADLGADGVPVVSPPQPPATTTKIKTGGQKGRNGNKKNKLAPSTNSHLPFKKRCKFTTGQPRGRKSSVGGSGSSNNNNGATSNGNNKHNKQLCFEDLAAILSKSSSAFQRVFPQDEKEAAILLMALSYGLVQS